MKNTLRGLLGKNIHVHTTRSNESIFGQLREVDDEIAVIVYGEHIYYISLDKIVWFQEWPGEAEPTFRSDFH